LSWRGIENLDLGEETVAAASNGFDEAGTFRGVAESLADFVDGFVEPVIEIHKSVYGPEFFLKFLASYNLAGVVQQQSQNLERLFLKPDSQTVLAQLAGAQVEFEYPKTAPAANLMVFRHEEENLT
jgi:hypothetical protein